MAPHPFWKGYLKLSLVTCPVAMTPAVTESQKVRFHTLNRETGHRIESRYVDAETGEPVEDDDQVKGYPVGEQDYVVVEDDELDAVALESSRTIDIEKFVPRESIGWIWYDRPHYLAPDGQVGEEAFSVIRDAMHATDMAGIARLVLYRRERAVMLEPRDRGLVLWTLRFGDEVRDAHIYFGDIKGGKVDPQLMSLVSKLIEERTTSWSPDLVKDPVQDELLRIISAKKKGKRPPKLAEKTQEPAQVINIMDALRRSLSSESNKGGRKS